MTDILAKVLESAKGRAWRLQQVGYVCAVCGTEHWDHYPCACHFRHYELQRKCRVGTRNLVRRLDIP